MVRIAKSYARVVTFSFALAASACTAPLEAVVRDGAAAHRYPEGLVITYDDRSPLVGGERYEISADGAVRRWSDPPAAITASGAPEETLDDTVRVPPTPDRAPDAVGRAEPAAMLSLLDVLDQVDPWDRPADDDDDQRVERRRALLRLERPGQAVNAWQWADPTETGDDRITAVRHWAETRVTWDAPAAAAPSEQVDEGPNPVLTNP